jgi:hypothetical protein
MYIFTAKISANWLIWSNVIHFMDNKSESLHLMLRLPVFVTGLPAAMCYGENQVKWNDQFEAI